MDGEICPRGVGENVLAGWGSDQEQSDEKEQELEVPLSQ
jgi:hypothetical protein